MRNFFGLSLMLAVLLSFLHSEVSQASDHDDGETDLKARSLNLTDVYVFREDKEVVGGSAAHLVFIINSNPRSLPQQQYYFSTNARYDMHIGRVGTSKDVPAVTSSDIILRVEFAAPNGADVQAMSLTTIIDGVSSAYTVKDGGGAINTTALGAAPTVSDITVGGQVIKLFAGLRRDPFFFDVTAFFRFRLAAAGVNGMSVPANFSSFPTYTPDDATGGAVDFTSQYNANTIAIRVPIVSLQSASTETVFDTWATISIPE